MKLQSISIEQECTFRPRLVSRRRMSNGEINRSDLNINTNKSTDVFNRNYEIALH